MSLDGSLSAFRLNLLHEINERIAVAPAPSHLQQPPKVIPGKPFAYYSVNGLSAMHDVNAMCSKQ